MATFKTEIRSGVYYDSAKLMSLQRSLAGLPGVLDAGVVMGTDSNKELLSHIGLDTPEVRATKPDDLAIVVKAESEKAALDALAQVEGLLAARKGGTDQEYQPRSLESAAEMLPDAEWVIVSVAGRYATAVTREALRLGKHVHLFSDNVSVENEIELKKEARELGLLVMGPDCGTAMVDGYGLAFANKIAETMDRPYSIIIDMQPAQNTATINFDGSLIIPGAMSRTGDAVSFEFRQAGTGSLDSGAATLPVAFTLTGQIADGPEPTMSGEVRYDVSTMDGAPGWVQMGTWDLERY